MHLLIDIGNTAIKIATANQSDIITSWTLKTDPSKTCDDYYLLMKSFIKTKPTGVAIASVVPAVGSTFSILCEKYFALKPLVLKPGIKTGLFIKAESPSEVGADLICDAVYAMSEPSLVIDLGTCNKYIYTNENKLLGVIITPGVLMQQDALNYKTALLPKTTFTIPKRVLANNTIDAINSGIFHSLLGEIKYFMQIIENEVQTKVRVYLTGGMGINIHSFFPHVTYLPHLTLLGLNKIYHYNKEELK